MATSKEVVAADVWRAHREPNDRLAGPSAASWVWQAHAFGELDLCSLWSSGRRFPPLQLVDFLGEIFCPMRPTRPHCLILMC